MLKVGDKIKSKYFNAELVITKIVSDSEWYFRLPSGQELKAQTKLSYFERNR